MSADRTKTAYGAFRVGFGGGPLSDWAPPNWEHLETWVRDALRVAYLLGKLDGRSAPQFGVGSIVRLGDGPADLMEITSFSVGRAYGDHALGGSVGAEIADIRPPSDEDMRTWHRECGRGK